MGGNRREGEAELQLSQCYRGLKLGRPFRVPWIRDKGADLYTPSVFGYELPMERGVTLVKLISFS